MNGFIVEVNGKYLAAVRQPYLMGDLKRAKVYRRIGDAKNAIRCHDLRGAVILCVEMEIQDSISCD